jgi:hypothetical protein
MIIVTSNLKTVCAEYGMDLNTCLSSRLIGTNMLQGNAISGARNGVLLLTRYYPKGTIQNDIIM